jgi:Protein of unknown function (DUF3631)
MSEINNDPARGMALVNSGKYQAVSVATAVTATTGSAASAGLSGLATGVVVDRIRNWLALFICPMNPSDLDLLALWITHTHLVNETYTTPRLLIESPVPESGKTTVLEHIARLAADPMQMSSVSSPAMITRVLEHRTRTLLIDEADRSLSPDKPGVDELIAVLNSGYKKGATRPVLVPAKGGGWDVAEMPTYAPVAMAGNQPKLPDDTMSRVIRVLIMPDHLDTVEDSDWELIEDDAAALQEELQAWARTVSDRVRTHRPELPEGAKARIKERWLPLKRVAVAAGGRWPEVVNQLVLLDLERMRLDREEGIINEKPHVLLLRNIAEVWPAGESFLTTDDIISMLSAKFPSAWGRSERYPKGLTAQRMGRMLVKNFGVYSDRPDTNGPRGYLTSSFNRALQSVRLLPIPEPDKPAQPAEPDRLEAS